MVEQGPKKLKKLQVRNETDKRVRVLCVEDVEVVRDTLAQLLEYHGYKVASAKNGNSLFRLPHNTQSASAKIFRIARMAVPSAFLYEQLLKTLDLLPRIAKPSAIPSLSVRE